MSMEKWYPPEKQQILGQLMKLMAQSEGHRPTRFAAQEPKRNSSKRRALRSFFAKSRKSTFTVKDIEEVVHASADTIRRVCGEFALEGWIRPEKTKKGFVYKVDHKKMVTHMKKNLKKSNNAF